MLKMFHRFPAWLGAAAFVFLTVSAQAAPVYLSPSDYDPKILLPAPPREDPPPPRPSWRSWIASKASAARRHSPGPIAISAHAMARFLPTPSARPLIWATAGYRQNARERTEGRRRGRQCRQGLFPPHASLGRRSGAEQLLQNGRPPFLLSQRPFHHGLCDGGGSGLTDVRKGA